LPKTLFCVGQIRTQYACVSGIHTPHPHLPPQGGKE
jgi:hypothetical protein